MSDPGTGTADGPRLKARPEVRARPLPTGNRKLGTRARRVRWLALTAGERSACQMGGRRRMTIPGASFHGSIGPLRAVHLSALPWAGAVRRLNRVGWDFCCSICRPGCGMGCRANLESGIYDGLGGRERVTDLGSPRPTDPRASGIADCLDSARLAGILGP